jgi:hypothetical protein
MEDGVEPPAVTVERYMGARMAQQGFQLPALVRRQLLRLQKLGLLQRSKKFLNNFFHNFRRIPATWCDAAARITSKIVEQIICLTHCALLPTPPII